ncbi:MAG: hypothetical protein V2B18_01075 [Pseudomonadota bacterium]
MISSKPRLNGLLTKPLLDRFPLNRCIPPAELLDVLLEGTRLIGQHESERPSLTKRTLETAERQARLWRDKGVTVISTESLSSPAAGLYELPAALFAAGDLDQPRRPAVSILNSRLEGRAFPDDPRLCATRVFFEHDIDPTFPMVSSYGTLSYDIVCRLCRVRRRPLIMVCPGPLPHMMCPKENEAFLFDYGDVVPERNAFFVSPFIPGSLPSRKQRLQTRDSLVGALSWEVRVGFVRPGGIMSSVARKSLKAALPVKVFVPGGALLERSDNHGIIEEFKLTADCLVTAQSAADSPQARDIAPDRTGGTRGESPLVLDAVLSDGRWLFHYTRAGSGPWPGQSRGDYCSALIEGREGAGHTAFDTLVRILTERKLRAGSDFIRGGNRTVSFTEIGPDRFSALRRWRKGLAGWAVEPYGLALKRARLAKLGAQPVVYGREEDYLKLDAGQRYLFQIRTGKAADWTTEKEWRHEGDLSFDLLPGKDVRVIVPTTAEARLIKARFGFAVTLAATEAGK